MQLTVDNVTAIFSDCLFKADEPLDNFVKAEGLSMNCGFHPVRLESHRADVLSMLKELPDPFMQTEGGGWSFLNACMTKDGELWTGQHAIMEQLFVLGIGLNLCQWLTKRELWESLPGGMPYVVVLE
jgi:hypothetical protein